MSVFKKERVVKGVCVIFAVLCLSFSGSEAQTGPVGISDLQKEAAGVQLDDSGCGVPDILEEPRVDIWGMWWVKMTPGLGTALDGFLTYYDVKNKVYQGFFTDQNGENHSLSALVSGYDIHWDFARGGALNIHVQAELSDDDTIIGQYRDCRDGSSGTVRFTLAGALPFPD